MLDIASLPFNGNLGIGVDGSDVILVPGLEHSNHVDTVHATVIYGVAEATSGQCLLKCFPNLANTHFAVLRSSTVKYRKPGLIGKEVRGTGTIAEEDVTTFNNALNARGRASIEITVSVSQEGTQLLTGTFDWFSTKK